MKPSLWTSYLFELLPGEMAETFARRGWKWAELSEEHGHDLLGESSPEKAGRDFRQYASERGLSFLQGHFCMDTRGLRTGDSEGKEPVDISAPDNAKFEKTIEYMKRWIDLFNSLGIDAGVVHAGGNLLQSMGWPAEKILNRRVEALRRISEYARGGPTFICLENCSSPGTRTAEDLLEIIDASGSDIAGICLDTGHANINGVDPAGFIAKAGKHLKALHVADNAGVRDDHILPYSRGTVRWPEILQSLRTARYNGLFNFEIPGENNCPFPVRLAKMDYIRNLAEIMAAEAEPDFN